MTYGEAILRGIIAPFVAGGTAALAAWWSWSYIAVKLAPGAAEAGLIVPSIGGDALLGIGVFVGVLSAFKEWSAILEALRK